MLAGTFLFGDLSGREVMAKVQSHPLPESMVAKVKLTIVTVRRGREKIKIREMVRYQKFYSEGKIRTKSLIRFLRPRDVQGVGFLTWDYRQGRDKQWLFLPAVGRVQRIAAHERTGSFMGTDFTYEDLEGRDIDDDEYTLLGEDSVFGIPCYMVEGKPVNETSSYSRRVAWIDRSNWLLKKVEFYDRRGKLLKILTIPRHERRGRYWLAPEMTMENVQNGHRTVLEFTEVNYDTGLRDDFFTERFLMRTD
jgi:hypothetical protein